jgi:hypothetical protein
LILGLKEFADGRVLVNDAQRRRLIIFDSTLKSAGVIADTTGRAGIRYGSMPSPLISYLGDSAFFIEWSSQTILVLDAVGKVARVTTAPKPKDINALVRSRLLVDQRGRLFYRGVLPYTPPAVVPGQREIVRQPPDSAPIVRADFDTRRIDTVGMLKMPTAAALIGTLQPDGSYAYNANRITPLSWVDEWTLMPDGSVAIVRGQDYHIDWISPEGAVTSSPKMSFNWLRLTEQDKQRVADSARKAEEAALASARARSPLPAVARQGELRITMRGNAQADSPPMALSRAGVVTVVPLEQVPDYWPPIRLGGVATDLEGNIWILPATAARQVGAGLT